MSAREIALALAGQRALASAARPDEPRDPEQCGIPRATLDAAEYLISENDPKRFEAWLLKHSPAERVAIIAYLEKCRGQS